MLPWRNSPPAPPLHGGPLSSTSGHPRRARPAGPMHTTNTTKHRSEDIGKVRCSFRLLVKAIGADYIRVGQRPGPRRGLKGSAVGPEWVGHAEFKLFKLRLLVQKLCNKITANGSIFKFKCWGNPASGCRCMRHTSSLGKPAGAGSRLRRRRLISRPPAAYSPPSSSSETTNPYNETDDVNHVLSWWLLSSSWTHWCSSWPSGRLGCAAI